MPAPAVAKRDRDRALGVVLADDEAVEFGNDFARGKEGAHTDVRLSDLDFQAFDGDVLVGEDADVGGDLHRALGDLLGGKIERQ